MFDIARAKDYMAHEKIDTWLVYDFRGSNAVLWQILGAKKFTTRRCMLLLPAVGEPTLLVHFVDGEQFADINLPKVFYASLQEMQSWLRDVVGKYSRLAMEYSPGGAIPLMSSVDCGTVESLRALGAEVVSSANLFQIAVASWDATAVASHFAAAQQVDEVKDVAFDHIRQAIKAGRPVNEYEVQKVILQEFQSRKLETVEKPIVAVNQNSRNPHYMPSSRVHSPIKAGDWVLIDLWARQPGDQNVFADITWVGYVGPRVPTRQQSVFAIVREARDLVVNRLRQAWTKGETLQGWQLDDVARGHIEAAGYGQYFSHRTGHSMGPGETLHALGVNLDNFETHDTRDVLPGIGFSIEPGIYLPEFGIRSEINVFMDPAKGPVIATPAQNEVVKIV